MAPKPKLPITRRRLGDGFQYVHEGKPLTKRADIDRIDSLAIPPAWTMVKISRSASAKVQASGVDGAGRTQTLYHSRFRRRQDRKKFVRATQFGRALPKLRARVDRDLRRRGLGRDRVVACVIHLIDEQLFRVGNPESAAIHGSFGITTLRKKHLKVGKNADGRNVDEKNSDGKGANVRGGGAKDTGVSKDTVVFNFVGKSGKVQRRKIRDPRAARVLTQLLELPSQQVFRYLDDDEEPRSVRSADVNAYLQRHLGKNFSAKDFRTWGATVRLVEAMLAVEPEDLKTASSRAAAIRQSIDLVAEKLGNTAPVAKESYIDPRALRALQQPGTLKQLRGRPHRTRRYMSEGEQRTLALLADMSP